MGVVMSISEIWFINRFVESVIPSCSGCRGVKPGMNSMAELCFNKKHLGRGGFAEIKPNSKTAIGQGRVLQGSVLLVR